MHLGKAFFCHSSDKYDFYGVTKASENSAQSNSNNTYFVSADNINSSASSIITAPKVNTLSQILLKMSVLEMTAENFIGAVWIIYKEGCNPLAAKIFLLPSVIGVGCAVYAQMYVVRSADVTPGVKMDHSPI